MLLSWQHRFTRPVWKESILPLIFYGDQILPKQGVDISTQSSTVENNGAPEKNERLMEVTEMRKIGDGISIRFQGSEHLMNNIDGESNASSSGFELNRLSMQSRQTQILASDLNRRWTQ